MVKIADLKKQILLEDIEKEHLEKISEKIQILSLKKGDYAFKEKGDAKGIYLIHSGKLEISKTTPDGWKQTLTILGAGHFCGELSILENRKHEADATAIEDTTVFLLSKEEFERIENDDLLLANIILKKLAFVLSRNLRRMNEKFLNVLVNY
ncbi:MAG: cyclic nucleotide-binding domain-containing protein [Nitrospirae bacterium]|jgi:CRP-like cAMP-binding protein|nr:cyclic nucleotide-binding domain-containing protein [Nitrospirota bacterium]MCL5062272.1 cyclic nucleotide-binding domain-containing protein [Nitrospirota bacterium]MDA8215017.1 cyclic nucleotide-binding domain-containing protein [Nitrospiraceae bacterium]MDA8339829.1 cyclic nucleotide-binding domain-containing protein [Nitrospiraceae bacterium]